MDKLIRGMDKSGKIRFFGAETTNLVQKAREIHNTTPVVTAAIGRALTANAMMAASLKGENETISIQLKGDGPLETLVTVGNCHGEVRGYVGHNAVEMPLKANGKLDVGGSIGKGHLTVVKDLGMREPYVGRVELQTGEIGDDLTYYFASSEQTPSIVALGVLVDRDYSVKAAGGYIIQLMPDADDADINMLETTMSYIDPITKLIDEGKSIEEILELALDGFDMIITDEITPEYKCNCSRERLEKVIISLGREEIQDIIEKDKKAELTCYFCNTKYHFNEDELNEILRNC